MQGSLIYNQENNRSKTKNDPDDGIKTLIKITIMNMVKQRKR